MISSRFGSSFGERLYERHRNRFPRLEYFGRTFLGGGIVSKKRKSLKARFRPVGIPLLAMVMVLGLAYAVYEINIAPNQPAAYHIHTGLIIVVNEGDRNVTIPISNNIGHSGGLWNDYRYDRDGLGGFYPILTLPDFPGQIHVHSRVQRDYTLGDFFRVWGKALNSTNVVDIPNDEFGIWYMFVGDDRSLEFENHVLRDNTVISLYFGPRTQQS